MANAKQAFFKRDFLNDWKLWTLVSVPITVAVIATMATREMSRAADVLRNRRIFGLCFAADMAWQPGASCAGREAFEKR